LKSRILLSPAVLLLVVLAAAAGPPSPTDGPPTTPSRLRDLVNAHPDSALLHARLASAYFAEGTIEGRHLAIEHLKRALRLDPANNRFRLLLAEVYFAATFWGRGVKELEQILGSEPGNGDARFRLGRAYLDRAIEEWQEAPFQRARRELSLVEKGHPAFARARRKLALCYFDMGKADSAVVLLHDLPGDSLDVEALLVMGMALDETGRLAEADSAFTRALARMDETERERYLTVDLIASSEELKQLGDIRPGTSDPERNRFWKRRDPDPATPYNERLIEHMARVAFAEIHFSVPRLGRPGSLTTRGEVYIRYGRPLGWFFDPFGDNTFADETIMPLSGGSDLSTHLTRENLPDVYSPYRSRPRHLDKPRWVWKYREFTLDFEDTFLNGDYTFPYERDWSAYTYAYLEREIPEIYEAQIKKRMRVVLDALNRLDDEGRPWLTLVYACDTRGVDYQPEYEWPEGDFEVQIALLDTAYADIVRSSFMMRLSADSGAIYRTPYPMISSSDFTIPSGDAFAAISIRSQSNGAVGYGSRRISVRSFGQGLQVSDVALRFTDDGPANPSHVYLWRSHAHLAFDIYNLTLDTLGTGRAEVAYSITRRPEEVGAARRLMDHLGLWPLSRAPGGIASVESRYELRSPEANTSESIGLDLEPLSEGYYDVELTVRDLLSGETATVTTAFRIASELRP
jgi:GWxTD domain-containing protein